MDELRVIATGLKFPEGPVVLRDGSIAFVEIERQTISVARPDGRVEVLAQLTGGPNGLAVGPDAAFYVCNNGGFIWIDRDGYRLPTVAPPDYTGGRIERVDPATGKSSVLYDRCGDRKLSAPNDLVFDMHGGFYFTDTGKARANDRTHGAVYYARADGWYIVEIAHPVVTPNGIGLSPDGRILYYADMEPGRIWAFDILEPGVVKKLPFPSPHGARLLFGAGGFQRFDSLAVSECGNVCVGTLAAGCITVIAPDGALVRQVRMPDLYPTNICFGGPDRRAAFITLSLTGKLVSTAWPEVGLPLAYEM